MNLILISGAEATCKSDLGRRLAEQLHYTYQSKDSIKEALYDTAKKSTWDFGWYEAKAKQAFFNDIKKYIATGANVVIESNFIGKDKEELAKLIHDKDVAMKEIHCYTHGLTSFTRAVARNESGKRHPGHHDRRWYPKILFQSLLHTVGVDIGAHKPVRVCDEVLMVDTTRYPDVDFESIIEFLR